MGKQADMDREARLEWLRARARELNSEALHVELEIAQLEVEAAGLNPDASDDGEFPIDEWASYCACAEADPFLKQECADCGRHVGPSTRWKCASGCNDDIEGPAYDGGPHERDGMHSNEER